MMFESALCQPTGWKQGAYEGMKQEHEWTMPCPYTDDRLYYLGRRVKREPGNNWESNASQAGIRDPIQFKTLIQWEQQSSNPPGQEKAPNDPAPADRDHVDSGVGPSSKYAQRLIWNSAETFFCEGS